MKKQLIVVLFLLLTFILSSCINSQDEVNKAKQNLWIIEWGNQVDNSLIEWEKKDIEKKSVDKVNIWLADSWSIKQDSIEEIDKIIKENESKQIEIKSLTDNQLLKLDDLFWKNLLLWEVEITWKTLWKVDKIVVKFSNETSDFPDDTYTLKQFVPWGKTFLYRAFSRYETLDFWKNTYIFEAYSGDEVTKLQLILNITKEEEKKVKYDNIDVSDLPSNEIYWTPTNLGDWKISYSDLNWLEIKRDIISDLTCEKVTSVLANDISWYFYWNTCRPIKDKEWVSFFVIRLDWDKYIYEKHYYLAYQWLYWTQELETGTWVTSVNIWEKNSELKERNEDFWILKITDELFKEILK